MKAFLIFITLLVILFSWSLPVVAQDYIIYDQYGRPVGKMRPGFRVPHQPLPRLNTRGPDLMGAYQAGQQMRLQQQQLELQRQQLELERQRLYMQYGSPPPQPSHELSPQPYHEPEPKDPNTTYDEYWGIELPSWLNESK